MRMAWPSLFGSMSWVRRLHDKGQKPCIQPQRIVVTHFGMMEYFFALEAPPIASTLAERMLGSFETVKPYAKRAAVKDIGEVTTPNLELMTEKASFIPLNWVCNMFQLP